MKDYYYFLGVSEDASDEDIKKAYRKLSVKYHPDKNANDEYFADRFREVQEAYDVLSDKEKRKLYNQNFEFLRRTNRSTMPPSIKTFTANKIRASEGEEIIIKWMTNNADVVKIMPFGLEKPYGERVFKITEFKDGKFKLLLHAQNSLLRRTAVQGITINQIDDSEKEKYRQPAEEMFKRTETLAQTPEKTPPKFKIILALLFLLVALFLLVKSFR